MTKYNPDYDAVNKEREARFLKIHQNQSLINGALAYYSTRPVEFIMDWGITYDPRNAGTKKPAMMPFLLFDRQKEFVHFLHGCMKDQENGAIEKCRDVGATWVASNFSVWGWLFQDGSSFGWGSRKESLVDKLGDPDSIFEKIRMVLRGLPAFLKPVDFNEKEHVSYMKILNPNNGSTITGEAGDNIGRGGRKSMYFKDEAQPLDSGILTPSGWDTMGNMKVGSIVVGKNGKQTAVTQIKDFENKDIYKIKFNDGSSTECSTDHLWQVEKSGNKGQQLLSTVELLQNYVYNAPGGQTKYRYRIPFCDPIEFVEQEPLPMDPYLLGAMLGDGYTGDKNNTPSITSIDEVIFDSFRKLLPSGVILGTKDNISYRIVDELGRRGWKHKSRSRKLMIDAEISGLRSKTKYIPSKYKFSSKSDRFAVLQGLMDTDGSASGGVASFHTSSGKLAQDVKFLVQSLGGVVTHNMKPNSKGYDDMNVLHIALPDGKIPFRLNRKIKQLRKRKQKLVRSIKSISLKRKGQVRCITVDNEDGLYLTDDLIVTHNSAHYERPETIEAALGDNTNVQIDISSVNGPNTVFQRRINSGEIWERHKEMTPGKTRIFIFDWRDHPLKDQAWYEKRKAKAEEEGLMHLFAQEVDRDASSAVEGTIIPVEWINSAIDAHKKFKDLYPDEDVLSGMSSSAFDVADEGRDRHAFSNKKGIVLRVCKEWKSGDVGQATQKALFHNNRKKSKIFQYDSIGVGAGVKSETNRMVRSKILPKDLKITAWSAAASPLRKNSRVIPGDKQSPKNGDFYANLKAQGWWQLRIRFEKTHKVIAHGAIYPLDELISISSLVDSYLELVKELSQPTYSINGKGKMVVDKNPDGSRSPNRADATMMLYWPITVRKLII